MRLKTNRKRIYERQFIAGHQHGEGIREVAAWVLRKGKKGLMYAKKHSADIVKLAAAAVKLYQGDTSSVIEAVKTATDVFGMDELNALKNVIQNKEREIKKVDAVVDKVIVAEKVKDRHSGRNPTASLLDQIQMRPKLRAPKDLTKKVSIEAPSIMSQIQSRPKLRPVTAKSAEITAAPSGSLAGMLDAIRARRAHINPDDVEPEQSGLGAQRILLKMAKHSMKGKNSSVVRGGTLGASMDRTLPGTHQYITKGGKFSDVMGGISTISGIASTIPGPHEIVTVPLTVITGLAGGIAKIFGGGKTLRGGSIKDIKRMIYNRIIQARNDMKDGGYMPSLKLLAKEIVMDVMGVGSKMLETKVRSMLGSGLKVPGQGRNSSVVRGGTLHGSGILDISVKFLTGTILPKILKKMGLHLSSSDLKHLDILVKQTIGDEPLTIKRAIKVAQELSGHLYRLYKGKQSGDGLKMSGGRKALTSMIAREIIKKGRK